MKATYKGIVLDGTPKEIAEFIKEIDRANYTTTKPKPHEITPYTNPYTSPQSPFTFPYKSPTIDIDRSPYFPTVTCGGSGGLTVKLQDNEEILMMNGGN